MPKPKTRAPKCHSSGNKTRVIDPVVMPSSHLLYLGTQPSPLKAKCTQYKTLIAQKKGPKTLLPFEWLLVAFVGVFENLDHVRDEWFAWVGWGALIFISEIGKFLKLGVPEVFIRNDGGEVHVDADFFAEG